MILGWVAVVDIAARRLAVLRAEARGRASEGVIGACRIHPLETGNRAHRRKLPH